MKPGKPLEELSDSNKYKLVIVITVSISLLALSAVPAFIDPVMACARYSLRIAKGSLLYNMLNTELAGALVEAYVFNITNGEKFMSGEDHKLKLEEVGPFTYQEFRSHEDFFLDEEAETLRYTPRITSRFCPECSVADPNDINVTVLNIPLVTMGSTVANYPYWAQFSFNMLANNLNAKSIYNLKVHDLLWGYNEPLIALGNKLMPGWINFENLGLMDRLYNQSIKDTIIVGASDRDKFRIKSVNGFGGMKNRGYDKPDRRARCNTFVDTYEGLAYPPGLTPETRLRLYRNVFCRILDIEYVGSRDLDFMPKAFVYRFSNTTFKNNADNECLCGNICVDGMTDLSPCFYGFGVSFSQAHFFDVDPKVYERIEGLQPDLEKHGSEFIIDPNTGSVLSTRVTLQLNLVVENANSNVRTKPFSHMTIPVIYFIIVQPDLPDSSKTTFRFMYIVIPYVLPALQVILFVAAVSLLAYAIQTIRLTWFCKKALCARAHMNENSAQVCSEQPLITKNPNFTAIVISNNKNEFVGRN